MIVPIYSFSGRERVGSAELPDDEPWVCGADFCDRCGDCMSCFGSEACYSGDVHLDHDYVIYKDGLDGFMKRHPNAILKENEQGGI